jgi:hypothetical protein
MNPTRKQSRMQCEWTLPSRKTNRKPPVIKQRRLRATMSLHVVC